MKKYFHQYHVDSRQYKHDYIHPGGNNNRSPLKANATSSFFKTDHTPKSSINELNLNNISKNGHTKNKPSTHSQNNINKSVNENDLQLQSNNNNNTNRESSIDSQQRVNQKGFSLQYMKMTKRHKIKQLVNLQSQRSSMMVMNLNNSNTNYRGIRAKTTFDQPIVKRIGGEVILRTTEYSLPKSEMIGHPQLVRVNLLLNKTLNDLKLPNTSVYGGKKKRVNPLLSRIQFAGNILQQSSNLNERKKKTDFQNTPISFIPLNNSKHNTDKKFFTTSKNPSIDFDASKSTLKKSNYSPFKSRNGNYNEDMKDIQTKQFLNDSQLNIKPFSTSKDVKTYKLTRHKRIKTHQNGKISQEEEKRYLSIGDNQNTIKIIEQGLYGQVKLLCDMKQCFQTSKQSPIKSEKIPLSKIRQLVKFYVFGSKDQKKYSNKLFSQLDFIFQSEEQKHMIKKIIACQRLVIICIVDLLSHQKLFNLIQEVKLTLVTLIVVYLIIWKQVTKLDVCDNIRPQVGDYFDALVKIPKHKTKSTLDKHLKKQLLPYIENLFRYSKELFEKQCKKLVEQSKERTINRTFYETLKKYAIYLTNNEERMINKSSGTLISSFATCPAPYVLTKAQKRYTLCVDLDETLLYSKFSCAKKFDTSYRPGAKEFIIQLNKYFEIVIFTSAVKQYADQVVKPFVQFVDHILYRYHVTRGKNLANTVKDLSRIGRKLQRVIFIDDLQCNIKLQPDNSIKVTPWKGDMNDKQIVELKGYLLALGKDETDHEDVRKVVGEIKQKFKQHKKNH